ncbi:beta-ketoacyl-[acyl-carrier-protein] synthase family protein [Paracoccaceae bacterium]|nr:beta-ketoacyl-[acyl-carrier-protein] synthase family protein [Paracoccaceae bacterium]
MKSRVVITGQGAISSIGSSVAEIYANLREGKNGISELNFPDVDRLKVRKGGQIKNYDPSNYFDSKQIMRTDRFSQFALIAAAEAINNSGLELLDHNSLKNVGIILGTSIGGVETMNDGYKKVFEEGINRLHPFTIPKIMNNSATSLISIEYNIRGPSFTVSSACSSANHAMGLAYEAIKFKRADIMVTGGSESFLSFGGIKPWESLRVLSPTMCRPFSKGRDGLVHGEGACIFVFENLESAKKRGADIIAEVIGFSMSSDSYDLIKPSPLGSVSALSGVLKDGKIGKSEVSYINAHGTGTVLNDKVECDAIKKVFGKNSSDLKISSTKPMHGHLIGATAALELLACTLALNENIIPPTINYLGPDPACNLDIVANHAQEIKNANIVLNNSFAFGGMNAVLALKKFLN